MNKQTLTAALFTPVGGFAIALTMMVSIMVAFIAVGIALQ